MHNLHYMDYMSLQANKRNCISIYGFHLFNQLTFVVCTYLECDESLQLFDHRFKPFFKK